MPKNELQHYLCLPFCSFYKPGSKETLLCRGAWLVERLVQIQKIDLLDLRGLKKDDSFLPGSEKELEALVCEDCPFRVEDCDFKAEIPPQDARPCGGLLLLKQLVSNEKIVLEDLMTLKD